MGSAPEDSPDHLRNGLWAASQLISAGSSRANKRVLIFTRDENPAGSGSQAESHRHFPCPPPCHQRMHCSVHGRVRKAACINVGKRQSDN